MSADFDHGAIEIVAGAQTRFALALLRPQGIGIIGLQHSLPGIICSSPYPMALLDDGLRHLGASDAYCTKLHVNRTAVLGRTHQELFSDLPKSWEMAQQRCLAGESAISEGDWCSGNGNQPLRLSWRLHPWRKSRSKIGGAILFLKEISVSVDGGIKSADLLTILDNAPGFIALAKPSGVLTFINKTGRELIGLGSMDSSARLTFADLAHPVNESKFSRLPPDCNWREEIVVRNLKTGEAIPLLLELRRIHDEAGTPCGFAWIGTRLRDQDPASQKHHVIDAESQHAEKLDAVRRVAGRVAHDLNNVLLVIDAYGSMLIEELASNVHLTAEATAIHRAGTRATKLVQELLALSQF